MGAMSCAVPLEGRTAVVTGGGSGIGRATAEQLARAGADVGILDRDLSGAEGTAALVRAAGRRATAVCADVASSAEITAAAAALHAALGPVHVLINVAGIGEFAPLMQMEEAQWDRMIAIHLKGTFNCTRTFVPDMITAGFGRVVSVASVAGLNGGGPGLSHYAAAKGGIIGFTKALAQELGPMGITVNAVAPGLIDTPMIRVAGAPDNLYDAVVRRTPVGRLGLPSDVATAIVFLCGPEAGFMNGQVLSPNGGVYT